MKRPKNILLITTDEQRADALGHAGNAFIRTPNLDALARESVWMSRHTCSTPICTPARASILTGQYAQSHGAVDAGYELPRETITLADRLHDAGFVTAICGKLHLEAECSGKIENLSGVERYFGFREFHITEDVQRGEYLEWVHEHHPHLYDEVRANTLENDGGGDALSYENYDGVLAACYKSKLPDEVHPTRWITDRSLQFMAERRAEERPWFLWASYVDPHHPWNPIEPYASMYDPAHLPAIDRSVGAHGGPLMGYNDGSGLADGELNRMICAYYAMISHIDHHVGRLLGWLRNTGMLDETLVIFTSDHGDYNGQRGMIRKRGGLYEDLLRVPMICRLPGGERAGTRFDAPTQHEDIAPTVLDLMGLEVPPAMEGVSFLRAIRGESAPARTLSYFYNPEPVAYGVADGDMKLVSYPGSKRLVLTRPGEDPKEMVSLSGEMFSERVKQLKLSLCDWLVHMPMWRPSRPYPY